MIKALTTVRGVPGKPRQSFGNECDILAVDQAGNLLAVEVKPRGVASIRWAAAQATVYARLFQMWLAADDLPKDAQPLDVLRGMARQRSRLGLAQPASDRFDIMPEVIPVVVVPRGKADTYMDGLRAVQDRRSS